MINLRSLISLLPYYFKEQDTYKVNGKGLLERYLEIFGNYFDDHIVKNIDTLKDIIDVDKTPEIYLGYLWEFLGSMPYANPKAIDPERWKQYFNGFDDDSTIDNLSKTWIYRKDFDQYHYTLSNDQVRALVKYSVALFSIRGTKRFFEVLLRLYGFEVLISTPGSGDDPEYDFWGSDDDFWGSDDDFAGKSDYVTISQYADSEFDVVPTKLDSEWMNLDEDTIDNHLNCTKPINVNFKLSSNYTYNVRSVEFYKLQDRMFNLINLFLPIGVRPHLIWDHVTTGNNYHSVVNRYIEVYIDRTPMGWDPSDSLIVESDEYPGWYKVLINTSALSPTRVFSWFPLRFMVKIKDTYYRNDLPAFIQDQPKRFTVAFDGTNYSDTEYEDGYIFTLNPNNNNLYYPHFKVSVLCEDDFDLTEGTIGTFIISKWAKEFNYNLFKHYNPEYNRELSIANQYIPVLIQSAFVKTYTNNANPVDDDFIPKQVINLTTGEYLTLCEEGTTIPDREGNPVDYSQYADRYIYVQHLLEPGIYKFAVLEKPEYNFTIEVTTVDEVLTISLIEGSRDIVIDKEQPNSSVRLEVVSNLSFLGHDDELVIKESSNPVSLYWDNKEVITLSDPGYYRFYGVNTKSPKATSNFIDISVISNKYNVNYYLDLKDGDKTDDESYMLRTLIKNRPSPGSTVEWSFDFYITLDKSVLEAMDILALDRDAFDLEVLLYRGGSPNRGLLLGSHTATVVKLVDDMGNLLPHYTVKGTITLSWNGEYNIGYTEPYNYPPGLYCVELHSKNNRWPGSPSYRVIDAYVVPLSSDGNLYFDVDVISKAWTSPAGQAYDINPITGRYTWGWFKTNEQYLHSVRLVRYDPSVDIPNFRLKLTNNVIGYTRVYMYKLVDNGSDWDTGASYPKVLPPIVKSPDSSAGIDNLHWLSEAIPSEWGFPGSYNESTGEWDYGSGYTGRWLFTGSVYQIGDIIKGPQEPGKYLFLVNQLEDIDDKNINYAYLEVKENIQYTFIVDPMIAVLNGSVASTTVDVVSSAKYTKENLVVKVTTQDGIDIEGYYPLPYAFYAFQAGVYTFTLYKREEGVYKNLGLTSTFEVLLDNGVTKEYLNWEWSDTSERVVQVATTSPDTSWTVEVQND